MDDWQLRETLAFAVEAAQIAGACTLGYFNTDTQVEVKDDESPVTAADRRGEERLRERIEKVFPTHGILGEEFGEKVGSEPARWIIDPIDGTFSFVSGVPLYSVLVGLEWHGEMTIGVVHMPALAETVYAARGIGCYWNGRRARVSDVTEVGAARLSATSVKMFEQANRLDAHRRLCGAVKTDRGWADAYGYACLATGRVDVVVDPQMSIWDNAALLPVITEAGGRFTDWSGAPTHTSPEAVATNGHLHDDVLALLRG